VDFDGAVLPTTVRQYHPT
jgi:NADH dehydrogenase (ubiquinone) Fe-S protein 8